MASYDDTHRSFLQVFFSHPTLTFTQAQPILAAIQSAHDSSRETLLNDITQADFNAYIQALNSAISPFDMEIRSTLPQDPAAPSGAAPERCWALVNTTSDPVSQLATPHTPDEIGFVKRLLDAMFETYNTRRAEVLAITSLQAIALSRPPAEQRQQQQVNGDGEAQTQTTQPQGLNKQEAERCLDSLVAEGWLCLSRKKYYRLSTKALMELRSWLVETYNIPPEEDEDEEEAARNNKVKACTGCGDIVIVGQRCGDLDCAVRVHDHCLRNVLRAAGGQRCPACRRAWNSDTFVGERAVQARRSTGGAGSSRVVIGAEADDEE